MGTRADQYPEVGSSIETRIFVFGAMFMAVI